MAERESRYRMAAFRAEVMQGTSDFHGKVGETRLGVAKNILDNPTTFHACNAVFNLYPGSGDDFVQPTVCQAQVLASRFFFGWKEITPAGW